MCSAMNLTLLWQWLLLDIVQTVICAHLLPGLATNS